jgi:hypothetical protein
MFIAVVKMNSVVLQIRILAKFKVLWQSNNREHYSKRSSPLHKSFAAHFTAFKMAPSTQILGHFSTSQ